MSSPFCTAWNALLNYTFLLFLFSYRLAQNIYLQTVINFCVGGPHFLIFSLWLWLEGAQKKDRRDKKLLSNTFPFRWKKTRFFSKNSSFIQFIISLNNSEYSLPQRKNNLDDIFCQANRGKKVWKRFSIKIRCSHTKACMISMLIVYTIILMSIETLTHLSSAD
jgi:hypothetical protein